MKRVFQSGKIMPVLAMCTVAAGCTTALMVRKADDPASRVGVPYPLMLTQYQIEVTRQVASCGPVLKALVKAEIKKTQSAPDPFQNYTLDTNSLSNIFKTSSVKVGYNANQGIATLNATAESHEVAVISNVVGGAVKLATILAVAGAGGATPEACSQAVLDAKKQVDDLKPKLNASTKIVEALTEDIKALTTKVTAMGVNVDQATKAALSKKYDALTRANADSKDKSNTLDKALKVITYTETKTWPSDGDKDREEFPMPEIIFKKWGSVDKNEDVRRQFDVVFELSAIGRNGRTDLSQAETVHPELGVPYRLPVPGRLEVCAGGPCSANNLAIAATEGDILQYGHLYYLPCTSRPFSSVECSFELTETGQIKSMGTVNKVAAAEAVSGAVKDALTQATDFQEVKSSAQTKRLEAETAALKAQAERAAAVAALQPDPTKPDKDATVVLQAQTDLLNAKLAQLEADEALKGAMTKVGKTL